MGQQNTLFTGPMLDVEPQQIHHHRRHHHPEPCMVSYGGVTCFPQPYNNHTILPPPGNRSSFDPRYLPESHGQLPYVIAQYNGEHCNMFLVPSPSVGVFSVPASHDHLPFSNHHQMFERNRGLFMDGSNGAFKGHLVHGGQPIQTVPNPWMEGTYSWNHAHGVPYLQGCMNGGGMEGGNLGGIHGYQVAAMSRNPMVFVHPPPMRPHQGPHNVYHPPAPPLPPVQAQNMDVHLQLPSTSHNHSTSTSTTYPFLNGVDPGPSFGVGPTPPTGLRLYEPHPHEFMIDSTARHRSFPHLRVRLLPEDELLALGEQVGNIDSGLSDNFISDHLKTRTFASSRPPHLENSMAADEEPNFCVICQMEFDDEEKIGMLDCCHEYHVECIKKWLVVKNNCPICKSTALT